MGNCRKKERRKTPILKDKLGPKLQKERTEKEGKRTQLKRKNEQGEKIKTQDLRAKREKEEHEEEGKLANVTASSLRKLNVSFSQKSTEQMSLVDYLRENRDMCTESHSHIDSIQNLQRETK